MRMNISPLFLYQFFLSTIIIVFFYFYIKLQIFNMAPKIAYYFRITQHYSIEMAKGVVELPLVVLFHIAFSVILMSLFSVPLNTLGFTFSNVALYLLVGVLLGIGMMSFSSLLCRAVIEILRHIPKPCFALEIKDWLVMTRSGWLRHYFHTIDVLSLPLALSIIFAQICCEEIVFRGILLHYFLPAGLCEALMGSTILFMFMQLFHMPNLMSSIFPWIGSMVIGVVNGILYLKQGDLLPLIIAHFTFFIVAVL